MKDEDEDYLSDVGNARWVGVLLLIAAALCGYAFGKLLEWAL